MVVARLSLLSVICCILPMKKEVEAGEGENEGGPLGGMGKISPESSPVKV
jgi:hypothetical protein